MSRKTTDIRATLSREGDAANWEPGLPQRSQEEGQWTVLGPRLQRLPRWLGLHQLVYAHSGEQSV